MSCFYSLCSSGELVGHNDETVRRRIEVVRVARGELEVVFLRHGRLKGIGEFPAVFATQLGSYIRCGLVERKAWEAVQQRSGSISLVVFSETDQRFGSANHGKDGSWLNVTEVAGCGRNAVEVINQNNRVKQYSH